MSFARLERSTRKQSTDSGTPSLSRCFLRQSVPLYHIPTQPNVRTLTHSENFVATTVSGQPTWLHSGNQWISSEPHWHRFCQMRCILQKIWGVIRKIRALRHKTELYCLWMFSRVTILFLEVFGAVLTTGNFLLAMSFYKSLLSTWPSLSLFFFLSLPLFPSLSQSLIFLSFLLSVLWIFIVPSLKPT